MTKGFLRPRILNFNAAVCPKLPSIPTPWGNGYVGGVKEDSKTPHFGGLGKNATSKPFKPTIPQCWLDIRITQVKYLKSSNDP